MLSHVKNQCVRLCHTSSNRCCSHFNSSFGSFLLYTFGLRSAWNFNMTGNLNKDIGHPCIFGRVIKKYDCLTDTKDNYFCNNKEMYNIFTCVCCNSNWEYIPYRLIKEILSIVPYESLCIAGLLWWRSDNGTAKAGLTPEWYLYNWFHYNFKISVE